MIRGLISRLSVRLRFLVRGRRDQDLRDELELHLELLEEERRARGEASAEARAAARRQFGNAMRIQETSRDILVLHWLDVLRRDTRSVGRFLAARWCLS